MKWVGRFLFLFRLFVKLHPAQRFKLVCLVAWTVVDSWSVRTSEPVHISLPLKLWFHRLKGESNMYRI